MTRLVCGDDIRQEVRGRTTSRLCQSPAVNLLGYGGRRLGDDGVTRVVREGHLLSCLLTSALAVWLMVRASKSAGGSSVLRSRRGKRRKTRWEFCLEEKYNPVSLFYCAGRDQMALCYDWALWVILSSSKQQRGDDSFWDRGSKVVWRFISKTVQRTQRRVLICCSDHELLLLWIVVWAVSGQTSNSHNHLTDLPWCICPASIQNRYRWLYIFDWLLNIPSVYGVSVHPYVV